MNLKRLFAGVLACCIVGGALPSFGEVADNAVITVSAADDDEYTEGKDGVLSYRKYADHIEISGCDSSATSVEIPAEIDGVPVTSISNYAFQYCRNLTEITLPDSVTSIGERAFYQCEGLTKVTMSDSVTSIGVSAFEYCTSLTSITIPDSVTSIGRGAFSDCSNLTSITIPDSVTSIGRGAFSDCSNLTSITISDSVTSIDDFAFSHCGITEIIIPGGSIGRSAFWDCPLKSVTLMEGVTEIDGEAFLSCKNLTSIAVPSTCTKISADAFSGAGIRCLDLYVSSIEASLSSYHLSNLGEYTDGNLYVFETNIGEFGKFTAKEAEEWEKSHSDLLSIYKVQEYELSNFICETFPGYGVGSSSFTPKVIIRNPDCKINNSIIFDKFNYWDNGYQKDEDLYEWFRGKACNIDIYGYVGSDAQDLAERNHANFFDITKGTEQEPEYRTIDNITYSIYGNGAQIEKIDVTEDTDCLEIPNEIDGYPVLGLRSNFLRNSYITHQTVTNENGETEEYDVNNFYSVKKIIINQNLRVSYTSSWKIPRINSYEVNINNPIYSSCDGVLYNKAQTEILAVPYLTRTLTIPKTIDRIDRDTLSDVPQLESITILNPDCKIVDEYWDGTKTTERIYEKNLDEDNDWENWNFAICSGYDMETNALIFTGKIYGYENSTAQDYAIRHDYQFVSLGEAPENPTTAPTTSTDIKVTLLGDANCDGKVSIADSTAILQALGNPDKYGLSEQGAANADCCDPGDGILPSDALAIQKVDAKVISKLPEITK